MENALRSVMKGEMCLLMYIKRIALAIEDDIVRDHLCAPVQKLLRTHRNAAVVRGDGPPADTGCEVSVRLP